MGFNQFKADPSLFYKFSKTSPIYFLVYIDDVIITKGNEEDIQCIIDTLYSTISLKYLGLFHHFLGIEISYLPNGDIMLTQSKYIREPLEKAHMDYAKPIESPILTLPILSTIDGELMENSSFYRVLYVALQYIIWTRPDIVFFYQ